MEIFYFSKMELIRGDKRNLKGVVLVHGSLKSMISGGVANTNRDPIILGSYAAEGLKRFTAYVEAERGLFKKDFANKVIKDVNVRLGDGRLDPNSAVGVDFSIHNFNIEDILFADIIEVGRFQYERVRETFHNLTEEYLELYKQQGNSTYRDFKNSELERRW